MTTLNQQNTNQEKSVVIGAIRTVEEYEDIPDELIQNTIARIKKIGFTGVKVESRKNMPIHVRRLITAVSHPDENVRLCMEEMIRGDRCFDIAYINGVAKLQSNPFHVRNKKSTNWGEPEVHNDWKHVPSEYTINQELCQAVGLPLSLKDIDQIFHIDVYVRPDLREQMAKDVFKKEKADALKEINREAEWIKDLENKMKYARERITELQEDYLKKYSKEV